MRKIKEEEISTGGLVIARASTDEAQPDAHKAVVVAKGEEVGRQFKPGTYVLVGKWAGVKLHLENEDLQIIVDKEVMAIL